jgi:diacylglycerol kinase (ATP)
VPPRVALLVNPTSGGGRGARAGAQAALRLRAAGLVVDHLAGRDAAEAEGLARDAVERGCDAVVAVGGDGMVNLAAQVLAETSTPLGLVPAGTGNDFARMLGLHGLSPASAADVVVAGLSGTAPYGRRVDLGQALVEGAAPRWFAGVLSSGFDSAVNERGNAMRWPRGRMRYNLAIVAELGGFRPVPYTIEADGLVLETAAMLVAVGNGQSYGGGMKVTPGARLDDGLLDVTVLGALGRVTFVRLFPRVYRGTHVEHPSVQVLRARTVRVQAAGTVAYADGERLGPLPVEATCVPDALAVLAPPCPSPAAPRT